MAPISFDPTTEGQRLCDVALKALEGEPKKVRALALTYDPDTGQVSIGAINLTPLQAAYVLQNALLKVGACLHHDADAS